MIQYTEHEYLLVATDIKLGCSTYVFHFWQSQSAK